MDPYRLLFPAGWLFGISGAAVWILFSVHIISNYPGIQHPDLMIGGFLFCFAAGFLMTAIPRFTGSPTASSIELMVAVLIIVGMVLSLIAQRLVLFHAWVAAGLLLLAIFGFRRFRARSHNPPPSFVFVGVGILMGIAGLSLVLMGDFSLTTPNCVLLGRELYYQGLMLSLILGVGTRLIPALLGHQDMPLAQIAQSSSRVSSKRAGLDSEFIKQVAAALLLVLSFVVEVWISVLLGRGLRAAVVSLISISKWKMGTYPKERSRLAFWLWISCWMLNLGLWGYALIPSYAIHLLHLTFIGGFGLMTLMIATRVTLAHGGHDMGLEDRSKALTWTGILIVLAAFTRAAAPLIPAAYFSHLAYAASAWILGLLVWGLVFLGRMFRVISSEHQ